MDPQIVKVIIHVCSSTCLDAAGDAIVESRTTNVPTALQGRFDAASLTNDRYQNTTNGRLGIYGSYAVGKWVCSIL